MKDFKSWMMALAFGLPVFLLAFIAFLYFGNCGFNNDCSLADQAPILHTPIPTLIPATLPPYQHLPSTAIQAVCSVRAETLLAAWVNARAKETDPFTFTDEKGSTCQAVFADVQVLFKEVNLWYQGALACVSCHNANLASAAAQMDLSSYAGIQAGSRRTSSNVPGNNILGNGNWDASLLKDMLFVKQLMPFGRLPGAVPEGGPLVQVGKPVQSVATPTATGPVSEVPQPSNPGGPGQAVDLVGNQSDGETIYVDKCAICHGAQGVGNVPNPGSDDGTVPPLNPIDPLLIDPIYKNFATNIDLFIQHGSTPSGANPLYKMPAWGDTNTLTQQQIADVIAYLISLNP